MQMVNTEGKIFLVSASEVQSPSINSFEKWEEAFSVYAGIFEKAMNWVYQLMHTTNNSEYS